MSHQSQFDIVHKDTFDWIQAHDVMKDKGVGLLAFFLDLVGRVL